MLPASGGIDTTEMSIPGLGQRGETVVKLPSFACPQEELGIFLVYEVVGDCADSAARSPTSHASPNYIVPSNLRY